MKNVILITGAIILLGLFFVFFFPQTTEIILPSGYSESYIVLILNHDKSDKLDWGLVKRTIKFDQEGLILTSTKNIDLRNVVIVDAAGNTMWEKDQTKTIQAELECHKKDNSEPDVKVKAVTWYLAEMIPPDSLRTFNLEKIGKGCD